MINKSNVPNYLNSQNPVVSGVEVVAAVETAPIWVPIVLGGLLLSIPSDSSQSNQSQNTSVSPTPEATPATSSSGAGARVPLVIPKRISLTILQLFSHERHMLIMVNRLIVMVDIQPLSQVVPISILRPQLR